MVLLGVTDTERMCLGLEQAVECYRTPKRDVGTEIVAILEDTYPHSVTEIASRVNVEAEKVRTFLQFLAHYSFIIYDEQNTTAMIYSDFAALA